ncbi:hypothetical protein KIW84_035056 [Lathyrus oleraceus]|uniref:Uncharacterized protein n=1 Tax=Pisum sativum TaxID=3888 RepID=A0A9D4Y086_PEA|nr:hypothetical protein KIW84_035056 [Pisum sativum]
MTKVTHSTADHVNKIIRSLPKRWRSMVTAVKLSKDLNNTTLEELMSSLRSHEIELEEDEPQRKVKFVALKSMGKSENTKTFQAEEEEDSEEDSEEEDQLLLLSRRVNLLWKKRQSKFRDSRKTGGCFGLHLD